MLHCGKGQHQEVQRALMRGGVAGMGGFISSELKLTALKSGEAVGGWMEGERASKQLVMPPG